MSYYSQFAQFSSRTAYTDKTKLWDPSETFEIYNPYNDCLTCVGLAPSQGRRCRNSILASNRSLIINTLNEISYLPPNSPAVMSKLRAIAGPALCKSRHQGQADKVVEKWQSIIQLLEPQIRERKPTKPVKHRMLQELVRDRKSEELENQRKEIQELREEMARLREELLNGRQQRQDFEWPEDRVAKDRQEEARKQRIHEEKKREERRKESERLENERLAKEKREKEERERLETERLEKERIAQKKREKEEKERLETERAAKEAKEKAEKQRQEREEANERMRKNAQKRREETERKKQREKEERERQEQAERKEWELLWAKYQERWTRFRASTSTIREGEIRDAVPWPVKSGAYRDVKAQAVKEFFEKTVPKDQDMVKLMRKECRNWHPDSRRAWLPDDRLGVADRMMVEMICRVVTELKGSAENKSSECLG